MSMPPNKLQQIIGMCVDWSDKRVCTKNQLQSLLGSLLYVSKCVKPNVLNVVEALKVWGQCLANKCIQIYCDNKAVVDVLRYGRTRDVIIATCARNAWLLTAIYNISLTVTHIDGCNNTVADLLSRWTNEQEDIDKLHTFICSPVWMNTHIDLTLLKHNL